VFDKGRAAACKAEEKSTPVHDRNGTQDRTEYNPGLRDNRRSAAELNVSIAQRLPPHSVCIPEPVTSQPDDGPGFAQLRVEEIWRGEEVVGDKRS
jgi:hypothetical protein